jgi:hypothetical protein
MAENESTAFVEYRRQFAGLAHGAKQPVVLFFAEVRLSNVLDLALVSTRKILHLTLRQLNADWGAGSPPTATQALGEEVAQQRKISAIRYRSVAAVESGKTGCNVAIFKAAVQQPDFVRILGPTKLPLQKWP